MFVGLHHGAAVWAGGNLFMDVSGEWSDSQTDAPGCIPTLQCPTTRIPHRKRMHQGASLQHKHTYRNIHRDAKYSENYITFANNLNHTEYGKTKC